MSERVRASPLQTPPAKPKSSLIAYADPRSFAHSDASPAAAADSAPAPVPAAAAQLPPHRRITSDIFPVADADADPSSLPRSPQAAPTHDFALSAHHPTLREEREEEAEVELSSDEESAASPSRVIKGPSTAARIGAAIAKELYKGMDKGSAAALAALREKDDDGSLVEDAILASLDYDKDEDYVNEDSMEKRGALHRHFMLLLQFLMTVIIAFVTVSE